MSLRIHGRASGREASDFITRVHELSTHLSQMQDLPPYDQLTNEEDASPRNMHRGNVRWNGKVESDIVGREDEVRKLLARLTLKDGDWVALRLRIISVVAEEPIGKTALVRSVFDRLEIDHSFQCRVWVHVPEKFNLKNLLVVILKQTPVPELKDLEHKREKYLKEMLHKSLMELRYLIVFDNLREAKVMDDLMNLLVDSRNGSRVIVTTRDPKIPSIIDPWASPLELHQLDTDQSELLLKECGSISEDPGLKASILSKCSGSPPKILLLGGLPMASGDSSPVMDQLADNPTLDDIVSLSYDKLPYLLKPCLLYLCLFPRDSEISTRRLFQLWHAEGFPVLEFTAMECFIELVGRNLVHVVRRRKLREEPKSCRVPSFLHDFLCKIATQHGLLQIHSDTEGTNHSEESMDVNGCLWIVKYQDNNCHQESQKSAETDDPTQLRHLRSYVSFKMQKQGTRSREVEELLRPLISKGDSGLLRVLDLEGVYKPVLPDGLGNVLLNLRYLGLRWTVIDSIPESVGNMSLLETLDLKHTNVRNLPSSIWKMKSLQHLYMNEVCFDKSTSCGNLSNLQTLWGLDIGAAKSPMLNVLSESTGVEKLGLTCNSSVVEEASKCISKLTILRSLKLRSRDLFGQPSDLKLGDIKELNLLADLYLLGRLPDPSSLGLLPPNLKILTLSMSGLVSDPMLVLGELSSLEILNLFAGSYAGSKLDFGENSFPRLRVLKLWMLEKVKQAYVDETALRCLEELEIKSCGLLSSIYSLGHIESLKRISLIKVKKELATNINDQSTPKVFIKEKQLVSSPSSAEEIFHRF
ncbi:hypothetical protein BT93_H2464 [Corymbia citriodora subsp. variegata]|nr:hypothetical protein BT93_H2464 [Corymbia citriodora subsp. variegata]